MVMLLNVLGIILEQFRRGKQNKIKARQGVRYPNTEGVKIMGRNNERST